MQISEEAIQPFSEEKLFRKTEDIKNDVVIINLYISNHVVVVLQGVGEMVVQGTLLPIDLWRIISPIMIDMWQIGKKSERNCLMEDFVFLLLPQI